MALGIIVTTVFRALLVPWLECGSVCNTFRLELAAPAPGPGRPSEQVGPATGARGDGWSQVGVHLILGTSVCSEMPTIEGSRTATLYIRNFEVILSEKEHGIHE